MEGNNRCRIVILLLIIIIIILGGFVFLLSSGRIRLEGNDSCEKQNSASLDKHISIESKLVDHLLCNNSEEQFHSTNVLLSQSYNDSVCTLSSMKINGKELKDFLNLWVDSYEFYDNNIMILSGDTSGTKLVVYNLDSNTVIMNLEPSTLDGYWVKSYVTYNDKIVIIGQECGIPCGNNVTDLSMAMFEIDYKSGVFSKPKLVKKI